MARRRGWFLNQGDAFVLGAGFSSAISDHLPLLHGLGRVVADALADQGDDVHELEEAFQYDFESWLSYLAQGAPQLSESDNLRNQALFLDASFQIARTLALRVRQALQGEPIIWLQKLIEAWHEQRTSVVSFNYDTLVEEMFHR